MYYAYEGYLDDGLFIPEHPQEKITGRCRVIVIVLEENVNIDAMRTLQDEMAGEWEKAGINNEDDINELCREVREEL
jgi:hypothetical protein